MMVPPLALKKRCGWAARSLNLGEGRRHIIRSADLAESCCFRRDVTRGMGFHGMGALFPFVRNGSVA
jgi:hypothetical protein